ncbi:MAG TPA: hypothetical protein VGD98_07800 [Ktedonobacteraceae bacterium]
MSLSLSAPQCFFLIILAFAVVGFQRGWKRELVSLGFSLVGVLFLYLGGGTGLAQFLFLRLPVIAQIVVGGSSTNTPTGTVPTGDVLATTIITFIVIIGAGYLVGNRAFPKANAPAERLLGILPAIVSGYFLMLYVTNVLSKAQLITFGVSTPKQDTIGSYMLVIVVVAVVIIVAALVATSAKKSSGGGKK